MARVKRAVGSKKHRRQVLERAKGYYGNKSRSFRAANEQVMRSGQYAFRDRRARKGEFRRLWIQRINAACRQNGVSYSRFIAGLHAGRHRGGPQGPGRPGGDRSRRVRHAGRGRQGRRSPERACSGFTNPKVQRLRRLLGRRSARTGGRVLVVEGLGPDRRGGRCRLAARGALRARRRRRRSRVSRTPNYVLAPGVLERVATTETPAAGLSRSFVDRRTTIRATRRAERSWSSPTGWLTRATWARSCGPPRRPAPTRWCSPPARSTRQPEGRARLGRRAVPRPRGRRRPARAVLDGLGVTLIGTSSHRGHGVHRRSTPSADRPGRRQRGARPRRRRAGRRMGHDPPRRSGREPQRGDGGHRPLLRDRPPTRQSLRSPERREIRRITVARER